MASQRVAYSTHCSAIRYDHYSSARKVNLEVSDSLLGLDLLLYCIAGWMDTPASGRRRPKAHDLHHSIPLSSQQA